MRRLFLAAVACCLLTGAASASASAAPAPASSPAITDLAPVYADSPIAAYDGWIVWSEPEPEDRWGLYAYHDGTRLRIPIPRQYRPFDVDVGPDLGGDPALVFSRCPTEPDQTSAQPWSTAVLCRTEEVSLVRSEVSDGAVRAVRGASDSTPSIWMGKVAFQRRVSGSGVSQLLLYDQKTHHLRTLAHGAVPHACHVAGGCVGAGYTGEVGEIDLGPKTVAFSWHVSVPGVVGVGAAWEMRADRLSDGRSVLAGNGYVSGACGARTPYSPNAVADGLRFLSRWYHCEQVTGTLTATTIGSGLLARADLPAGGDVLWRIARDAATGITYAVLGPAHRDTQTPLPAGALRLVRLDGLAPQPTGKRASEPFS
jgi:hypothetical protein